MNVIGIRIGNEEMNSFKTRVQSYNITKNMRTEREQITGQKSTGFGGNGCKQGMGEPNGQELKMKLQQQVMMLKYVITCQAE